MRLKKFTEEELARVPENDLRAAAGQAAWSAYLMALGGNDFAVVGAVVSIDDKIVEMRVNTTIKEHKS